MSQNSTLLSSTDVNSLFILFRAWPGGVEGTERMEGVRVCAGMPPHRQQGVVGDVALVVIGAGGDAGDVSHGVARGLPPPPRPLRGAVPLPPLCGGGESV